MNINSLGFCLVMNVVIAVLVICYLTYSQLAWVEFVNYCTLACYEYYFCFQLYSHFQLTLFESYSFKFCIMLFCSFI